MVMKVYPAEFKQDAVALYLSDPGHTLEGVSADLGISRETLRNWVRAERARRSAAGENVRDAKVSEAAKTREDLEAEIAALRTELKTVRKENATLAQERDILRKATKPFRLGDELVSSRCQFIEDHRETFMVQRLCQVLEVARSSYYKWRDGREARAARECADEALAERIAVIHAESGGTYGSPRVTAELRDEYGMRISEKKVARVMRKFHIAGFRLRKRVRTAIPEPSATPVPDLFKRAFTAPNLKYMGDVTYLPVGDVEFRYPATVLDCFSRRVVGWSIASHMRTDLVADTLKMATVTRGSLAGAIFHSDHGAQYQSRQFAELCAALGVTQYMGAVGTSADNAACESFHASLKRETLKGARRWDGPGTCRRAVFRWLARYNTWRRHSANGHLSPLAYEMSHNMALAA
ncbi:IS3 family transposase [Streptomyces sp. AV19]|uniref:IS3 family transposase n=1 Tax=Streptomyces sp. AV19 TaxID=2793068 RepID=UPI0018FE645F|nr:IS3 family transposase [Streptomyces sp. AV19]MBH1934243.1 IS3 family transposase [Streptomyces sp. AV19]MDG4533448.1 IS3 family transposase [Streptomyces sp. AV19]